MQKLIKEVKSLVQNEYHRAMTKFGATNNSDHESFAILEEEVEELRDDFGPLTDGAMKFWELVKSDASDDKKKETLERIKHYAIFAACEAIQVAAMAYKAQQTINCRGEQK